MQPWGRQNHLSSVLFTNVTDQETLLYINANQCFKIVEFQELIKFCNKKIDTSELNITLMVFDSKSVFRTQSNIYD